MKKVVTTVLMAGLSMPLQAQSNLQQQAIEMFASHFDFTRAMHALNMDALVEQGIATKVASQQFENQYQVSFDQPYIDVYGNVYKGDITYMQTFAKEQEGNLHTMRFNDFYINNVKVNGAKSSRSTSVINGKARKSCWGVSKSSCVNAQINEPLVFEFSNGREITFTSDLVKHVKYDELTGEKLAYVDGIAAVTVENQTFDFEVSEPMIISGDCRWLESGVVGVSSANGASGKVEFTDNQCSGAYTVSLDGGSDTLVARHHNYWQ